MNTYTTYLMPQLRKAELAFYESEETAEMSAKEKEEVYSKLQGIRDSMKEQLDQMKGLFDRKIIVLPVSYTHLTLPTIYSV